MKYNTSPSAQATKCAIMHRDEKNGTTTLNGSVETTVKEEYIHPRSERTNYNQGGRLKFFKDGKFILELERAREGERVSWVSVPRKTFWPPQSTPASTPTYKQESSTSLSVSDDNSSIQSSPWQRDHSWKQTTPQRNLSKALCFFYHRPKSPPSQSPMRHHRRPLPTPVTVHSSKCRYRQPYNDISATASVSASGTADAAAAAAAATVVVPRSREKVSRDRGLLLIVQGLTEKVGATASVASAVNGIGAFATAQATRTPPRHEVVVSPRKRFLKEMDRENKAIIEDSNCQKRSRNKPTTSSTLTQIATLTTAPSKATVNGTAVSPTTTTTTPLAPRITPTPAPPITSTAAASPAKHSPTIAPSASNLATTSTATVAHVSSGARSSSYSITSLLANDRPSSSSSSSCGAGAGAGGGGSGRGRKVAYHVGGCVGAPLPPSVDERLYTENVDRLRSIELSQAEKRAPLYAPLSHTIPTPHPYSGYLSYHHHHPHHQHHLTSPPGPPFYHQHPHHHQPSIPPPAPPPPPPPFYYAAAAALYAGSGGHRYHPLNSYPVTQLQPLTVTAAGTTTTTTSAASDLSAQAHVTSLHHHHHHHPHHPHHAMHHDHVGGVWSSAQQPAAALGLRRLLPPDLRLGGVQHVQSAALLHDDGVSDMPLNLSKNAG